MRLVAGLLQVIVLAVGMAAAWLPSTGEAQERVLARAFQGPTFSRIVFDWPALVAYQAQAGGDLLVIEFDRSLTADLSPITDTLGDIVLDARVEGDGRSVTLLMSAAFQIKTTVNGASVIFDIVTPSGTSTAQPRAAPAPPPQPSGVAAADASGDAASAGTRRATKRSAIHPRPRRRP